MDVLLCAFRFQRQMKTAYILSIFIIHRYKCILNYRNFVLFSFLWFYEMGKPPLLLTMIFNDFRCSNIPQQILAYIYMIIWKYRPYYISIFMRCNITFWNESRVMSPTERMGITMSTNRVLLSLTGKKHGCQLHIVKCP